MRITWSGYKPYQYIEPAPEPVVDRYTPLYVEDLSGYGDTVVIVKSESSAPTITIDYSTDKETWTTAGSTSTTSLNIQVPANGKVYLRCGSAWSNQTGYTYYNSISNLKSETGFAVGGNVLSLLYGSSFNGQETFPDGSVRPFGYLFSGSGVKYADKLILPSVLVDGAFYRMFNGCSNLITTPTLNATDMEYSCYSGMFTSCSSLKVAPVLKSTKLAQECYSYMFYGCTALLQAPELPATSLNQRCYTDMFNSCTFNETPLLPAKVLATRCYQDMFRNCSNLKKVTCLATDTSATFCISNWLKGVANEGVFIKDTEADWGSSIPDGWTVQDYQELNEVI